EKAHAPGRSDGNRNGAPADLVVATGEARLRGARKVLDYYEARSPLQLKLYPADAGMLAEARKLFDGFYDTFGVAVCTWTSAYSSGANENSVTSQQQVIEATFADVEARLKDGRPFLMGTEFMAPDLALAALAAPLLIPSESPSRSALTPAMQAGVERWRARPAAQFILRLYREQRPERAKDLVAPGKHGSGRTFKDKLLNFLIQPAILRPVFALLRRWFPVLKLGKAAIISRYNDVIEVLKRDSDFTIRQINAPKIDKIDGPFILGMDAGPQYNQEQAALMQVVRRDDLEGIRAFVANEAAQLIDAARPQGRIDVVNGLARVVPVRLMASYFGILGPNDPTMMRWMRDIFHYIFANLTSAESVLQDALNSSAELRRHMDAQIALRKSRRGQNHKDDVLGRLLALQDAAHPWLDDNAVRRNLGGVIVGSVDTTSKFVALAMNELLRRPQSLAEAQTAARRGDIETVRRYAWEAVRFNPHHPLQVRYCGGDTQIANGQKRAKKIPAGTNTFVGTLSAMFDPEVFTHPGKFDAQRQVEYLHFGYGMHACFGRALNAVQIPELIAALLRLPGLRRASGAAGHILYDGPFPNRLVLAFDNDQRKGSAE
ncbi:MAG TPA: cytochrome P450, partial [Candidatus Angelobacter sp.]|nr:cytochrome P450 [Candidatus Angelobacter sp.]